MNIEQQRYPIGKYLQPETVSPAQRHAWIEEIVAFPNQLRETIAGMSDEQLDTPYREGGWTVRQVVHHLSDSHMNAYVRFKLTLTEERPVIKPYKQDLWAALADSLHAPVDISLDLLAALHARWAVLLRSMSPEDFQRAYIHPEYQKEFTLEGVLGLYAWHGRHHRAQIVALKERTHW